MTPECRQTRDRLDDLFDELLTAAEHREVEAHLAGCEACREELANLESLVTEAQLLPREIAPERDLWPGVEARLSPKPRSLSDRLAVLLGSWSELFSPQALAAAAAALVLVTVGVMMWRANPEAPATSTAPIAVTAAESEAVITHRAELARSEDGVLLARRNLIEAVEGPKEHLSPETVAIIEENMRIIDQAIGQISSALDEDPLNHQLNMLLAAQYQREAELLKQVSGV
jgi:hypothetical protein